MKLGTFALTILLFGFNLIPHTWAKRPAGNFGGHQQMDIDRLEKDLAQKFAIPFPEKRYDIDYFYKGDLLVKKGSQVTLAVTCPFVLKDFIGFALGTGGTGKTFKLTTDVGIDLDDSGKALRILIHNHQPDKWPTKKLSSTRKEGESQEEFFRRAEGEFLPSLEEGGEQETSRDFVRLTLRIIRASAQQNFGKQ